MEKEQYPMAVAREIARSAPFRRSVPWPIVSYAFLGLVDYALTLTALHLGASEANPGLAWFHQEGLFEFAKLSLTLLVCCIAFKLWRFSAVRGIVFAANVVMVGVVLYHAWIWATLVLR